MGKKQLKNSLYKKEIASLQNIPLNSTLFWDFLYHPGSLPLMLKTNESDRYECQLQIASAFSLEGVWGLQPPRPMPGYVPARDVTRHRFKWLEPPPLN